MFSIIVSKAAKCGTENRPFRRAAVEASVANQVQIIQADIGCNAESTHYGLRADVGRYRVEGSLYDFLAYCCWLVGDGVGAGCL